MTAPLPAVLANAYQHFYRIDVHYLGADGDVHEVTVELGRVMVEGARYPTDEDNARAVAAREGLLTRGFAEPASGVSWVPESSAYDIRSGGHIPASAIVQVGNLIEEDRYYTLTEDV